MKIKNVAEITNIIPKIIYLIISSLLSLPPLFCSSKKYLNDL